jgi:hypothetical protein
MLLSAASRPYQRCLPADKQRIGLTCQLSGAWNHLFVQTHGHLADVDIRRYVAGTVDPETGTVDPETERHVRVCVCCALRLADAALHSVWWECGFSFAVALAGAREQRKTVTVFRFLPLLFRGSSKRPMR